MKPKLNNTIKQNWRRYLFLAIISLTSADIGINMLFSDNTTLAMYSLILFMISIFSAVIFLLDYGIDKMEGED